MKAVEPFWVFFLQGRPVGGLFCLRSVRLPVARPNQERKRTKKKEVLSNTLFILYKYILSFTIYMLKFCDCQKLAVLVFAGGILPGSIPCLPGPR